MEKPVFLGGLPQPIVLHEDIPRLLVHNLRDYQPPHRRETYTGTKKVIHIPGGATWTLPKDYTLMPRILRPDVVPEKIPRIPGTLDYTLNKVPAPDKLFSPDKEAHHFDYDNGRLMITVTNLRTGSKQRKRYVYPGNFEHVSYVTSAKLDERDLKRVLVDYSPNIERSKFSMSIHDRVFAQAYQRGVIAAYRREQTPRNRERLMKQGVELRYVSPDGLFSDIHFTVMSAGLPVSTLKARIGDLTPLMEFMLAYPVSKVEFVAASASREKEEHLTAKRQALEKLLHRYKRIEWVSHEDTDAANARATRKLSGTSKHIARSLKRGRSTASSTHLNLEQLAALALRRKKESTKALTS